MCDCQIPFDFIKKCYRGFSIIMLGPKRAFCFKNKRVEYSGD